MYWAVALIATCVSHTDAAGCSSLLTTGRCTCCGRAVAVSTLYLSAEIATRTTVVAFQTIYSQINLEELGGIEELHIVAGDYAEQLQDNWQKGTLGRLVSGYPSHTYAIARSEAEKFFKAVRKPCELENAHAQQLGVDFAFGNPKNVILRWGRA